jgi:hypothetical protein
MSKMQLPCDKYMVKDYVVRTNLNPCLFFVPFLFMGVIDGMDFIQETPTVWRNGTTYTIYEGTERGIHGSKKDNIAASGDTPNMFRTDRTLLYFPTQGEGNLTCLYGKPEAYWGAKHGFFCPLVQQFNTHLSNEPLLVPVMWFVPLLLAFAVALWRGRILRRQRKKLKDKGADVRLTSDNGCCTHPVGVFLGFYDNGFQDAHLHIWVTTMTLIFVHSLLARGFVESNGKCVRFGNWDGSWNECLPLGVADVGLTNSAACAIFLMWVGALWTVPVPHVDDDNPYHSVDGKDAVTRAAVQMKKLVHNQMRYAKKEVKPMTLLKALSSVMGMFADTDQVQSVMGDAEKELGGAVDGILANVRSDFMADFGEQLDKIEEMADGIIQDGVQTTMKVAKTVQSAANQKFDGLQIAANKEVDGLLSGTPLKGNANVDKGQASVDKQADQLQSTLNKQADQEMMNAADMAQTTATKLVDEEKQKLTDVVTSKVNEVENEIKGLVADPLSLMQAAEDSSIAKKMAKNPYCSASPGAILGCFLGIAIGGSYMAAPMGAVLPYRLTDGFGQGEFCDDSQVWCNGQSVGALELASGVIYMPETKNMFADIMWQTIVLFLIKVIVSASLGCLFMVMLQTTVEPFNDAAQPLKVMSNIVSKWVIQKHVTGQQLDAWILARKSFLYNECTLMLKQNEFVVVFMIMVMVILVLIQVFMVFTAELVANSIISGIVLTGVGGLTCIQAALACYTTQQQHRHQLMHLKEAVVTTQPDRVKQIDIMIQNMEKQDYQTKLMFLPLNPALLKALVGYLVTAAVAIAGKASTM